MVDSTTGQLMTAVGSSPLRDGQEHTADDLSRFIAQSMSVRSPTQLAAWLMAAYIRGLAPAETSALTCRRWYSRPSYPLGFGPTLWTSTAPGGGTRPARGGAACASLGAIVPKMSGEAWASPGAPGQARSHPASAPTFAQRVRGRPGLCGTAIAAQSRPGAGGWQALRPQGCDRHRGLHTPHHFQHHELALGRLGHRADVKAGSGAAQPARGRRAGRAYADIGATPTGVSPPPQPYGQPPGLAVGNSVEC